MSYTVGEMAKMLNTTPSTLRYYDKEGLLPFVGRSVSGIRMFTDTDYEWLQVIGCLKKTGMSLKDIRKFIYMAMQGDDTIEERLQLFLKQKEAVEKQLAEINETLDIINFKCWYYQTAKEAGSTEVPKNMSLDEIPEQFRAVREKLRKPNKAETYEQKVE